MSSVAKGTAFEDRVFTALDQQLRDDGLGLSPKSAQIFKKKGYYSKDRDDEIIVDISIEVWLPKADRWSLLLVCECKDYRGAVPVSDIEEFKSKLDQIAGANKKGLLAVSGALQTAALSYARAQGIGVIRLLPDDQVEHILYHMTMTELRQAQRLRSDEFLAALTRSTFVGTNRDFYAEFEGRLHGDWRSLLKAAVRMSSR